MEWLRIAFTLCLFGNSFTEQRGNMTFGQWKHPHHDTIPVTKQVTLTLKKKVSGTWVKIPCFYLPNCIYPDVCFLLDQLIPPGEDCPQPLLTYNLPCHCPFKKGNYTFPETPFYLPYFDLPTWLTNGMYQIQTVLTFNRVEVTCLKIVFSLKLS
uniref:GM2 ganglioside activator n=1 Tax=Eptatretus burgeri TaxID=7764 RepID=A0A8C4RA27_EPTBU